MSYENTNENLGDKFSVPELVLLLLSTLTVMVGATLAPALPKLQAAFITTENVELLVRLTLTMPSLFIVIFAPVMGYIVDKWGRTKLLFITTLAYGIAGGSGFFLNSLETIILSRALLGVAVAGIMTAATTLIADYYQGEQRSKILGYQAGFMAFGGLIFIVLGGFLAGIGWQFTFLIYLAALPLVPAIWKYLHEPERSTTVKTTQQTQTSPTSSQNFPYLAIGIAYILTLLLQIFFFFTITELPFFLTTTLALDAGLIGLVLASTTLTAGSFSLLYKQIKQRFSIITIFIASYLFFALGFFIIYLSPTLIGIILSLLISGIGLGLFVPNITVWITTSTPESSRGRVLSGFTSFLFMGQFLSPLVSRFLLDSAQFTFRDLFALGGLILLSIVIVFAIANYFLKFEQDSQTKPIS